MASARVTSKGQITIPKSIRNALHLRAGGRVLFTSQGQNQVVLKPFTKTVDEVFGKWAGNQKKARSVREMNEAVQKRFQNKNL